MIVGLSSQFKRLTVMRTEYFSTNTLFASYTRLIMMSLIAGTTCFEHSGFASVWFGSVTVLSIIVWSRLLLCLFHKKM